MSRLRACIFLTGVLCTAVASHFRGTSPIKAGLELSQAGITKSLDLLCKWDGLKDSWTGKWSLGVLGASPGSWDGEGAK